MCISRNKQPGLSLTVVALIVLAGCVGTGGPTYPDLQIENGVDESVDVQITAVDRANGTEVVNRTVTVGPNSTHDIESIVGTGEYNVTVSVAGFNSTTEQFSDLESDSQGLVAYISADGVELFTIQ